MTSSMLAGERRWASARRGGMTVLGRVAVPKPLNLPSQKLENHGLDPNVEIVPKGSLSWGSRPSSSTSNPWGSSAVSPNSDGNTNTNTNTVSPRHPSGRPTSGGGLSRPSTAGSDRVHESSWGPNSRPSSASGVLTSNQSSLTVSRPLSAETRPGSSHLSRFAEPVFDNSMAWGPNGTVDKLSIPSNKGNDFSLSSGDFPTLGSEKDNPPKSSDPHDQDSHVRPGSASGRGAHTNERNEMSHADHKSGTVDTWTREGPPHMGENWQGDPHQYGPPQHYDAWRGPPMNAPGVWYRGPPPPPPPAGPPYTPVPHGGYPMEPFPYYRGPQIPPPLANSQQGPGPRAHHPRNNDFYRPNMPDAFIRPGMPMRPGFYPGPVPYEGYFGPPMGYNPNPNPNPNDRDNPFMGMPPPGPHGHGHGHGPPVYNMCPPQNPSEINDPHFRGGGPRGPNMFVPEHSDSVPPEEPRGPYKVLRKRENERPNADVDEGNWDQMQHTSTINSLAVEKNENQPRPSFHNRSTDSRRGEDVVPSRRNNNTLVENPSSRMLGNQNYPSSNKPSNESWGKRSETVTPVVPEVSQDVPPVNSKDPSLIQKIEGLNAKVRASDVASGNLREEPKNNRFVNQKDNSTLTFGTISNTEDLSNPRDINVVRGDNTNKSTTGNTPLISRQPHHGVRKGSTNNQNNDGWRKKPSIVGSDTSQNVGQVSAENPEAKNNTGESLTPMVDSSDGQAQRARMRELAKQRAIQLQKEEEERIKEQKAKALAKLEELNRRTLAADGTTQTAEGSVPEPENVEVDQKPTGPEPDASKTEVASSEVETKSQPAVQVSKNIQPSVHVSKNIQEEPVVKQTDTENRSVSVPSSTQQRKRNNKSSKSKPKSDDTSASLVDADVAKQDAPLLPLPPPPPLPQVELESSKDNKDSVQSNNQYNKGQHQHQRRMARNTHPQAGRSADRFHGNDGVMWAPVRANKEERGGDEYVHDDVAVSAKSGNSVQSNLKSRRAEMERYVPKAVAKELAQQGTTTNQQSASPSSPVKEDTSHKEEVSSEAQVPVTVVDNKQNRLMKSQQHKKNNPKPVTQNEVVTSETNATHEWDPSDGWFMPEYPPTATEVVKDEGNKGKKPVSSYNKTQRSMVKNHEEVETERPTSAKENRSSHWQPKPQGYNTEHGGERKPRGGRIHMEDEQAPFEEEQQQQQQTGFRKYGGGRGGRHNVNRERQPRQNLHYEYQPVGVGSNSNNTSSGSNNNADGSGNTGGGPRYKGQGQSRRGGGSFYGRQ